MLLVDPWCAGGIAEQPIELQSRNVVAFAGARPQRLVIEDRDVAAPIADQPGFLQAPHHLGDGRSPDTEHHSEEFMGEQKIVRRHAVARHQEPAATTLFNLVKVDACRRLRDLVEERMGITKRDQVQCRAALEFAAKNAGVHPERRPGNLDVNRGRCLAVAKTNRQSHDPFVADGADLGAGAVGGRDHERSKPVDGKINMVNRTRCLIEAFSVVEHDWRQMRPQPLVIIIRQERE